MVYATGNFPKLIIIYMIDIFSENMECMASPLSKCVVLPQIPIVNSVRIRWKYSALNVLQWNVLEATYLVAKQVDRALYFHPVTL